jgi:hypothetical protein
MAARSLSTLASSVTAGPYPPKPYLVLLCMVSWDVRVLVRELIVSLHGLVQTHTLKACWTNAAHFVPGTWRMQRCESFFGPQ